VRKNVSQPRYDKEQKDFAKQHNLPLCTLDIDDRHVEGERKGRRMTTQGPLLPEYESALRHARAVLNGYAAPQGRSMVYAAIDSERNYQDQFVGKDPTRVGQIDPDHSVGEYLVMLSTYLRKAQDAWTENPGDSAALHQIRKIAGIAVHCMEDHGAPHRKLPKPEPEA
jgi:hypothetical protein